MTLTVAKAAEPRTAPTPRSSPLGVDRRPPRRSGMVHALHAPGRRGDPAADHAGGDPRRVAAAVLAARRQPAAAVARRHRHLGADLRSVLSTTAASTRACSGTCWPACKRVALGYALAAIVGIALGVLVGQQPVGDARPRPDLPGAAHGAAAGLAAAVAGGVPRRPPLGDLRHLHHRDLADHHQHRRRHPQHPAGLPQRRPRAAPHRRFEYFAQDHAARRRRPTSSPACASASACRGSRSSRPRC